MEDPPTHPLVSSLVGEAIATLAEMGVSAQVLGEFAMKYPAKAATILGAKPVLQEPTDLEKVVFEQVTRALRVDQGLRVTPIKRTGKQRINVYVKGQRTTLTISASLIAEAERLTDGAGRKLIQDLAEAAPKKVPRSTWTEQKLHQELIFLATKSHSVVQH